eukprot:518405-Prorocentrum_minimum.AAC.1
MGRRMRVAEVFEKREDFPGAERQWRRCIELLARALAQTSATDPAHAGLQLSSAKLQRKLAVALKMSGRFEDALEVLGDSMELW